MIRSERYKYCVYTEGAIRESLVDMRGDPEEMKNQASLPEYKNALIEHRGYLEQWIDESGDTEAKTLAVDGVVFARKEDHRCRERGHSKTPVY